MVILPAAGMGLLVVLLAGFLVTYLALGVIEKTILPELSRRREFLTEKHNERLSLVGEVIAVVLLVDRLLASERLRTPNASFDELCRNAIARLGRENP